VKRRNPTITAQPALWEKTFHQLLAAVHILQECSDRRIAETKGNYVGLSDGTIAESAQRVQVVPPTLQAAQVPSSGLAVAKFSVARTDVELLALQNDSVIARETVCHRSALASQLKALMEGIGTDSELMTAMPVTAPWGKPEQIAAGHVGIHESNSPHRFPRKRIFQRDEFWRTAVFALAAICFLLLGKSVHRISPLPTRLALPSEVVLQEVPFRTIVRETSATTKLAAPTVVANQASVSKKLSSSPQKAVVKPTGFHSTSASNIDIVADQNTNTRIASEVQKRISADRRLRRTLRCGRATA
jgi:hypothetical protein